MALLRRRRLLPAPGPGLPRACAESLHEVHKLRALALAGYPVYVSEPGIWLDYLRLCSATDSGPGADRSDSDEGGACHRCNTGYSGRHAIQLHRRWYPRCMHKLPLCKTV